MTSLRLLRTLSWLEGGSLLALLAVAVPLKHVWNMPAAVRVLGSVHGLLFMAFALTLLRACLERRWSLRRGLALLAWATVPLGALVIHRRLSEAS